MTSIEWLENKLKTYCLLTISIKTDFEQAKEIHRQEIIDAWNAGFEAQPFKLDGEDVHYYNDILVGGKNDAIVDVVISKYRERSAVGIKKYGTTLEKNNKDDYLKHLQEELMDATLYIQKLMKKR
jgi:hypothetical protein